ncbi:hypothetical protein CB1_001402018, partial [Camelus ferus]
MSLGRAGYGSGRSVCKYSGAEREGSRSSTNVSSPNARLESVTHLLNSGGQDTALNASGFRLPGQITCTRLERLKLDVNTAKEHSELEEEEATDMPTCRCENCSGGQLDGKRIMSALKDFTAVLPNKPANAHYTYRKQKSLLFCLLLDK